MRQDWCDLLFAHWPVSREALRALVPAELELDLFDGEAWLGVVPFRMEKIRARFLPPVPGTSAFPEFNVRTYVRHRGRPGVWFFSLDAANRLAVRAARSCFHLPYFHARMECVERGNDIEYVSQRLAGSEMLPEFRGRYGPTGPVEHARPGTLEHWLTERYCLYALSARGVLRRGEIHHEPWPLQPAHAEIERDEYPAAAGLSLPDTAPLLHFARKLEVIVWTLESPSG
jgi:uncharacterized protein YqjF (DUF2071 family)